MADRVQEARERAEAWLPIQGDHPINEEALALDVLFLADRVDALETALRDPVKLAQMFHETYEDLAPTHGYRTRESSAVAWDDVPEPNRSLMIETCLIVGRRLAALAGGGGKTETPA